MDLFYVNIFWSFRSPFADLALFPKMVIMTKPNQTKRNVVKIIFFCMCVFWFVGVCRDSQLHNLYTYRTLLVLFDILWYFCILVACFKRSACILQAHSRRVQLPIVPPTCYMSRHQNLRQLRSVKPGHGCLMLQQKVSGTIGSHRKWHFQKVVPKIQKNHSENEHTWIFCKSESAPQQSSNDGLLIVLIAEIFTTQSFVGFLAAELLLLVLLTPNPCER